jgi:GST-like protein
LIKLYTWNTPNGRKISIALEEFGLDYEVVPVDLTSDRQYDTDYDQISPGNKIPAIDDDGFSLFESGAILLYLAEKTGKLLPPYGTEAYWHVIEWLMWQVGNLGPLLGQAHHFLKFNSGRSEYAEKRYHGEALRLYRVLNKRLENREYVCDDLSVADIAIWPWVARYEYQQVDLGDFPDVLRWYMALAARPSFQRGFLVPNAEPIPVP